MRDAITFPIAITTSDIDKNPLVVLAGQYFNRSPRNFSRNLIDSVHFNVLPRARSIISRDGGMMGNLFREIDDAKTFNIVVIGETSVRHLSCQVGFEGLRWCCGGSGVPSF